MISEEPADTGKKLIDVEALFASKNPRLLKFTPGFVIRYLKRITHQDAINGYIYRHRDKTGLPFVEAILKEFGVRTEVVSKVPLSSLIRNDERYIVAANHPLGGLDGMALIDVVGRVRPDIVFPVNDLLMNVPGLRPLFIPINKHGRNTENARIIEETFASGRTILYFPAGLCSRKQKDGSICDLEWKRTFITRSRRYRRDIIPVYISGRNSNWFYNLANWRKRVGIKANIEMLYLVDEMIRQKDQTIRIIFGEVIPFTTFDKSRSEDEWAAWVKNVVYGMKSN